MFQPLASWKNKTKKPKGAQWGDTENVKDGWKKKLPEEQKECEA